MGLTPGTLSKSVMARLGELNGSGALKSPIKPTVSGPLSALDEASALEILDGLVECAIECDNPTEWIIEAATATAEQLQQDAWNGVGEEGVDEEVTDTNVGWIYDDVQGWVATEPPTKAPRLGNFEYMQASDHCIGSAPTTPDMEAVPKTPDRDEECNASAMTPPYDACPRTPDRDDEEDLAARQEGKGKGVVPRPAANFAAIAMQTQAAQAAARATLLGALKSQVFRPQVSRPQLFRPSAASTPVPTAAPMTAAIKPTSSVPTAVSNTFKRSVCRNFQAGNCLRGANCTFAHSEEEQQQAMEFQLTKLNEALSKYKTRLCRNFVQGGCMKGDQCTFAHGEAELQEKDE